MTPPTPDPSTLGPWAVALMLIVGAVTAVAQVVPKILGPLGTFMAKRSTTRQRERDAQAKRSDEAGGAEVAGLRSDVASLTERINQQGREMTQLRVDHATEIAVYFDHINGLVGWTRDARLRASEAGINLPPPPSFPTAPTGACP